MKGDAVTAKEAAAFAAPADSTLTPEQVERYLRTTLAQLELIEAESPVVRQALERARAERARGDSAQRRRTRSPTALWSDFVDAAFVRSARRLGYNPAELWFVRERLIAVSGYLQARRAAAGGDQAARLMRDQAELLRGQPGVTRAQIDAMLQAADRAEAQPPTALPPRLRQNLEALQQARAALGEAGWSRIAATASGVEIGSLYTLAPGAADSVIGELRALHEQ